MADEGITFKTFGSEGAAPTTGGDQGQPPLSSSFAERAAAIKQRMAGGDQGGGAPEAGAQPRVGPTVANAATLRNLSEGRAGRSDIPASDYANMSWGEYLPKVASNVLPSTYEAVKGIGNAVIHPIDTASAIGQIGTGLGSKALDAAGEAVGYGPVLDPSKKAEREAIVNALGQSYAGRYGMGEEGEVWKHLAEDPASYLSDIASVATAGAGAAGKLGVIDKVGKVAKAAEMAGNLDPITAALKATGKVAPVIGKSVPYGLMGAQSVIGGVPMADLKMARQIALSGDPEKMSAFTSAIKGNPKFSGEAADAFENALKERMEKASQDYMTDQATAFSRTQPVDLTGPQGARGNLDAMINPGGKYGRKSPYSDPDTAAAQKALDEIDNVLTHPSSAHTIEDLDPVKKALGTIADQIRDPTLKSRVYAIAGELVTSMSKTDPAYGGMMKTWQDALDDVRKARSEIGRQNVSDVTKARRLNKSIKNNSRVFDTLEGTPSGKNLRYSMAGDTMKDWGGSRTGHILGGIGGLSGAMWMLGQSPMAAAAAVPGLALASPKLGGMSQYALGRAENLVNKNAGRAVDALSYSPALTNVASQYGAAREGRKSGGRVSSHEADADQLVRAAERAKKGWSAQTEPLLNHSDESVVQALSVANRSI